MQIFDLPGGVRSFSANQFKQKLLITLNFLKPQSQSRMVIIFTIKAMTHLAHLVNRNRTTILKTASYYAVHIVVAAAVAYAVTGSLVTAITLSLLEPTAQAVAYFLHEKAWAKVHLQRLRTLAKTASYYAVHLIVASGVAYAVTGDLITALTLSLLEPTVQMFFFYFHEKIWDAKAQKKARHIAIVCSSVAGCVMPGGCKSQCALAQTA